MILAFLDSLRWLDGNPLVVEPYRRRIFRLAFSVGPDGRPVYSLIVNGRAKKNCKTLDEVLAALYSLLGRDSVQGSDGYLLANDEDQAADDLDLAKKLIKANPELLDSRLVIRAKEIERRDGRGVLAILPARDVSGAHGKTASFVGFDEIHSYRDYGLLEALSPDPTRRDVLTWIASYDSLWHAPGKPLWDLYQRGRAGADPRMLFSWYSGDYTTDPDAAALPPEQRANPSMSSWANPHYLDEQRRRLPAHKYRRLHLNIGGQPEGAAFDAQKILDCVVPGRRSLPPQEGRRYVGFVDMSGGSADDAVLAIAHEEDGRIVLDLVASQTGRPPFDPRRAVEKFVGILREYHIGSVTGDAYAGQTFRADFESRGIAYRPAGEPKSDLYEGLEPAINAGEIEMLDDPKLIEQLQGLVLRAGGKIDHGAGDHDDYANGCAGVVAQLSRKRMSLVDVPLPVGVRRASPWRAFSGSSLPRDRGFFSGPPSLPAGLGEGWINLDD